MAHSPTASPGIVSQQQSDWAVRILTQECVDFQPGQPAPGSLPTDKLAAACAHCFRPGCDPFVLQYGTDEGARVFREALAAWLTRETGHGVSADECVATAGVSHGLDVAIRRLSNPGDTILVEAPTYFLASGIFQQCGLMQVPIPTDSQGLDVAALEALLTAPDAPRPKLLYIVPVHNNPRGTTLPVERRQRLLRLAHRHSFHILADEVYQLLSFPTAAPPPPPMRQVEAAMLPELLQLARAAAAAGLPAAAAPAPAPAAAGQPPPQAADWAGSRVVSLSSFSKTMAAPGMRLGWLEASRPLCKLLARDAVMLSGGNIAQMQAGIMLSAMQLGLLDEQLQGHVRPLLADNCAALCSALEEEMPGCSFLRPQGGYFIWLQLPPGVDSVALLQLAAEQRTGVKFVPGPVCNGPADCIRLSFSFYTAPEIREGVRRLAATLRAYLQEQR